ncbi:hypothetical protein CWE08_00755 [Aliidiomarina iranensis]|uniref:Flagellar hook-length control protein-like C-terminal domain-containing protein n=1 Tax=Aliidiomarina iranensis TaxID=1434071 RepID=A0A432W281_9GAMM|nr:flagellar hook-length control protein FliK [Aliidiomarina iranensis]RUO23216.1 hypothetical protein CWE08_00755 [Aliidiomarina iranensis]
MSGITPLLDTLLHQVLGPKGDQTAQKILNQPVRPVDPGEGPRALQSDSRLDSRANSQAHAVQPNLRTGSKFAQASYQQIQPNLGNPPSTQIALSGAGKAIADVLMQYPAPGSTIRPSMALIQGGETITPTLLADRLDASIRNSGVFYESTLGRWFRGELPRAALEQQPQMQLAAQQTQQQAQQEGRVLSGPIPEAIQPVVRQQLEMLSAPVLRWEGDLWSGIFLALFLHPSQIEGREPSSQDQSQGKRQEKSWRSELELTVRGLGALSVGVHLNDKQLHLLFVANDDVVAKLELKESILRDRLRKLGLSEVTVETRLRSEPAEEARRDE